MHPTRSAALVAVLAALALPASASALTFGAPQQLIHGDPNTHPYYSGGEPSIAFDPNGDGHVYVTAPQFIPTVVDYGLEQTGVFSAPDSNVGVSVWASSDGGKTFPLNVLTGAPNGGGDSDVEVLPDHSVLVADLEAAATDICTSTDFAKTFADCDGGLAKNQEGPENDREWLTRGEQPKVVYLTYHDFAGGFPIIERSDDGGQTFQPCGTIIDPSGPAAANYTPSGGTLVSKPVVAPDGTVYVEFAEPDATAPPVGASLDHMYVAVAKGGCTGQTTFTDYTIYENSDASLANIFQAFARDAGGELYVLMGGNLSKADSDRVNLYLFTSTDDGRTWRHVQVNTADLGANVLPAIAGGKAKGEAVLGWFGSASKDPNDTKAQWKYYGATTYDGGQTFATTTVTPDFIHYGDICTQGVFCGLIPGQPGNRNLADFSSAAVDPASGCAALAIPGDPYNNRPEQGDKADDNGDSSTYVSLQQGSGDCLTAANAGRAASAVTGSGSGSSAGGSKCVDRAGPAGRVSHVSRRRASGTAHDRGCGPKGAGTVRSVRVALSRQAGHGRCRAIGASGKLGKPGSCRRAHYLRAHGTSRWAVRFRHRLPKGRYLVRVRATDAAGNTRTTHRTVRVR